MFVCSLQAAENEAKKWDTDKKLERRKEKKKGMRNEKKEEPRREREGRGRQTQQSGLGNKVWTDWVTFLHQDNVVFKVEGGTIKTNISS